jgi:hypothetical protein
MGVSLLMQFMDRGGMPAANLGIEARTSKAAGKTRHFIVPVLRVPHSLAELGAGEGRRAIAPAGVVDTSTGEIMFPRGDVEHAAEEGQAPVDRPAPATTTSTDPDVVPLGTVIDAIGEEYEPATRAVIGRTPGPEEERVADQGPGGGDSGGAYAGTPQEPAPLEDDGTLADDRQWALLERHNLTANKILTKVRDLFPDANVGSKSAVTKHQFTKAFAALKDGDRL